MLLPAIAARFWAEDVAGMFVTSVLIALIASITGLLASYYTSVPTGPAIILVCGALYVVSMLVGAKGGLVFGLVPRRHLEA